MEQGYPSSQILDSIPRILTSQDKIIEEEIKGLEKESKEDPISISVRLPYKL